MGRRSAPHSCSDEQNISCVMEPKLHAVFKRIELDPLVVHFDTIDIFITSSCRVYYNSIFPAISSYLFDILRRDFRAYSLFPYFGFKTYHLHLNSLLSRTQDSWSKYKNVVPENRIFELCYHENVALYDCAACTD
jgi:hypothetical protein